MVRTFCVQSPLFPVKGSRIPVVGKPTTSRDRQYWTGFISGETQRKGALYDLQEPVLFVPHICKGHCLPSTVFVLYYQTVSPYGSGLLVSLAFSLPLNNAQHPLLKALPQPSFSQGFVLHKHTRSVLLCFNHPCVHHVFYSCDGDGGLSNVR